MCGHVVLLGITLFVLLVHQHLVENTHKKVQMTYASGVTPYGTPWTHNIWYIIFLFMLEILYLSP